MDLLPTNPAEVFYVTSRWKEMVRSEVEDIRGWRDAEHEDRLRRYWSRPGLYNRGVHQSTMPGSLFGYTVTLRAWIRSLGPNDDTEPIQAVYQAILSWHEDRCADRIPPQNELDSTVENAVMMVLVVEDIVTKRYQRKKKAKTGKPHGTQSAGRRKEKVPDDLISWVEAGDRLGVSSKTIGRYIKRELLNAYGPAEKVSSAEVARRRADGSLPLKKKRTTKGGRE